MSGKNWDRRLREEERKISKLLENICAKSDIKLDANGYPFLPTNVLQSQSSVPKISVSTQTEYDLPTSTVSFADHNLDDVASNTTNGSGYHERQINSFENVVFEQLRNDYEEQLRQRDHQLRAAEERIRLLESSLIETIKWRNSTCNHLSLLLQTFNQTNHVLPSAKSSNKANIIFVSSQQQNKLVQLHQRMQDLFEAKSVPVPSHLQSLLIPDEEFLRSKVVTEQTQPQIDRFSTFHRDYNLASPVARQINNKSNNNAKNTEDCQKLRVLAAQEEELCGLFFDLLTRVQVNSAEFREIQRSNRQSLSPNPVFDFNSLNMNSAEQLHSIGPRLFLTGLIALEVIDDIVNFHRAMDVFKQCSLGTDEPRLRYLDFIRAMDLLAAAKFPALAAAATDIAKGRRNSLDYEERRKSIVQQQRSASLYSPSKEEDTRSSIAMTTTSSSSSAAINSTTSLSLIFSQASASPPQPPPPPLRAPVSPAAAPSSPAKPQQLPPPPHHQKQQQKQEPVVIAKKRELLSSKALAAFAQGWTAKLQLFLQDFASLKRVITQCFLLTHPIILEVFANHQETIAQQYRRSKNYGTIKADRRAKLPPTQAMTVTSATGFELFAINHGLVPELLATSAARRIAQFSRNLLHNEQSTAYCSLCVLLTAQYVHGASEGQDVVVTTRAVMGDDVYVSDLLLTIEDMIVRINRFEAV